MRRLFASRFLRLPFLFAAMSGCDSASSGDCPRGTSPGPDGQCAAPCPEGLERVNGLCSTIRISSVGFLPSRAKAAAFSTGPAGFSVTRDGDVVMTGEAVAMVDGNTGDSLWVADFSEVDEEGDYVLEIENEPPTPFTVSATAFDPVLDVLMKGLYGQRCGTAVEFEHGDRTFAHGECHLGDADGEGVGGRHDAGDYGKYTTNSTFTISMMLHAWERFQENLEPVELAIPERGGDLPDYLDEIRWELEWLLKMQFSDGSVSHKLTAQNFEGFVTPTSDSSVRSFLPVSGVAAATFVGAMAQASRVYRPWDEEFAEQCLEAALRSYHYLLDLESPVPVDQGGSQTGGYQTNETPARIWAAAEMWETTGEADHLAEAESWVSQGRFVRNWDWDSPSPLGLLTYLFSQREGRDSDLVADLADNAVSVADSLLADYVVDPHGRTLTNTQYWGINGVLARTSMNLYAGYALTGDPAYLDVIVGQVGHLLGRNLYRRSHVTGIGVRPPIAPHHRPSVTLGGPWPGLLVGGPQPEPTDWVDSSNDYMTNEVAINWNGALIFAVAPFVGGTELGTAHHTVMPPLLDVPEGSGTGDADAGAPMGDAGAPDASAP